MIITVTLNPALDKTANIAPLVPGGLNRIESSVLDAGGKGINVSKLIASLGGNSLATGFVGGSNGDALLHMLDDLSLKHSFIRTEGSTRINLKLLDQVNGITEVNDPGIEVSKEEETRLVDFLFSHAGQEKTIFVLAGSMHAGADPAFYKELTLALKAKGACVFVDADGHAFANALEAAPDFIKPNKEELLRYFKKDEKQAVNPAELKALCRELIQNKGVGMVALSLGSEGALFVTAQQCILAPGLKVKVSSTVGAGDSIVGAIAYAHVTGHNLEDMVRLAMACSAGAVTTEGTKAPSKEIITTLQEQVSFEYV